MPFTYSIPNQDRIVFKRLNSGCGRFLFIFVGCIFTIIGVYLNIFSSDPDSSLVIIGWVFPFFGIVAIYAGAAYPSIQKSTIPDEIIFDNLNGRVEVNQEASGVKTAYIYYDEIEDITFQAKSSGSSLRLPERTTTTTFTW